MEEYLKVIREICKGKNLTEEEIRHRARLLFLINRLNFFDELPVLLEELMYQRDWNKTHKNEK